MEEPKWKVDAQCYTGNDGGGSLVPTWREVKALCTAWVYNPGNSTEKLTGVYTERSTQVKAPLYSLDLGFRGSTLKDQLKSRPPSTA